MIGGNKENDVKSCEKGMPFLFLLPEIIYFCKLIE